MSRERAIWLGIALMVVLLARTLVARWGRRAIAPNPRPNSSPVDRSAATPSSAAIRFTPPIIEFGNDPVFSGDRVRFSVAMQNSSPAPIAIAEFPRTCGCMTFAGEDDLKLPVTLQPGEKMPLNVEVATRGKSGYQTMQLQAKGSTASGEPVASAPLVIKGRILTSILPLPEELWLEVHQDERASPIVRTIILADEWPGDGLTVDKITTTAGPRLRFDLRPADGRVLVGGLDVRKRHELTITYSLPPRVSVFDESITVTPTYGPAKPARIRLHGRVLPNYEFDPSRILVYGAASGTTANRILTYHYHRPQFRDLRPIEMAGGVAVTEMDAAQGTRRFRVTCRLPQREGREEHRIVFQIGSTGDTVEVPISVVVRSQ